MGNIRAIYLAIGLLASSSLYGQVNEANSLVESEYASSVLNLHERECINLNGCTYNELHTIPGLTPLEAQTITEHRLAHGPFKSILELQVCGISPDRIDQLRPYFHIDEHFSFIAPEAKHRHHIHLTYSSKHIAGSWRLASKSIRFRSSVSEHLKLGFTIDSDPQEALLDFYSGFAQYTLKNTKIIGGDYRLSLGQGLTMGYAGMNRKSMLVHSTYYAADGLKPYTSIQEAAYLRGVAIEQNFHHVKLIGWYDRKRMDGAIVDGTLERIVRTGLHQTALEKRRKHTAMHSSQGLRLSHTQNKLKLGLTAVHMHSPTTFALSQRVQNAYGNHRLGLDYRFNGASGIWYGEITFSGASLSQIHGRRFMLGNMLQASVQWRRISDTHPSYYTSAFAETSQAQNETGYYLGLSLRPQKQIKVGAYIDRYNRLAFTSKTSWHSGTEYLVYLQYQKRHSWSGYLRLKLEQRDYGPLKGQMNSTQLRYHQSEQVSKSLESRFRIEYHVNQNKQNSGLVYQEFNFSPTRLPIKLRLRVTLAQISTYDNRIYMYTFNTPFSYSIPGISRSGIYGLSQISWKINRHCQFWLRFAADKYLDDATGPIVSYIPWLKHIRLHLKTSW